MIDYAKRFVEVNEVLKHLSKEDFEKIPKDIIQLIEDNMDKQYVWNFDENKKLKDQNLNRDTIAFLSYINMEYLLNDEQKAFMQEIHEKNEKEKQQELSDKYGYDDLFKEKKRKQNEKNNTDGQLESTQMIEYKEKFLTRLLNKIKKFFKK